MNNDPQSQNRLSAIELLRFLLEEFKRQSPDEYLELVKDSEFDANPIVPHHNAFIWRGNSESFSVLYERTVLKYDIFIVESEEKFKMIFGKMIPDELIRIQERCLSDAIYLFKKLSAADVRIIALTNHLQQIMPLVFETKIGPVKYGSVKTRANLACCVSGKRKTILDSIIEDVKWANRKR
ncbi:MAG: hypothetical protein ABIQ40_01885 [Bacteroidia bacterium]